MVWVALGTLYLVWGSTYLAIKVGIETLPPLLMSSFRFIVAGGVLYVWAIRRGDVAGDRPGLAQWRAAAIVGGALLLGGNGMVVVAEKRVPSGIAALLIATVPIWMAVIDRVVFRSRLPRAALLGLVVGFGGVGLLVGHSGEGRVDPLGAFLLIAASLSWAAGSLYSRVAPLPSRPLVSTAMEMICGGVLLGVVGLVGGEAGRADLGAVSRSSAFALLYLIVVGSWVGFTAYIWLLATAPTSLVSTYAYVNPAVAVFLGWAILDEPISAWTVVATGVIIVGVALIVTAVGRRPASAAPAEPASPAVANPQQR